MAPAGDSIRSLFVESKAAWRRWLRARHAYESGVWPAIKRKGSDTPGVFLGDAIEEALCFGWIDGKMLPRTSEYFILRFAPRKPDSVWSEANKRRAFALIKQGKMDAAGLAPVRAAKKRGAWGAAYSLKQDLKLPADLKRALMRNSEAWETFKAFPKGARNMFVIWVTGAKRSPTRARRIEGAVRMAAQGKKLG